MKSTEFLIHLTVKESWKEKICDGKTEEKGGADKDGLADVTLGKVCILPCKWVPARMKGNNPKRNQQYRQSKK
jgi:hypothetical protein